MTMRLLLLGKYRKALFPVIALLLGCSRHPGLSIEQAQAAARGALTGYSQISLGAPLLFDSDRPDAQYRLQCSLHAEKQNIVINLPSAVFYFSRATDGTWHVDARGPIQDLNETWASKKMFSREALQRDQERVKKWQAIP